MTPEELVVEAEKLAPWAQAAYEAFYAPHPGAVPSWGRLTLGEREPWIRVADAVLDAYDDQWQHEKAGL